MALRLAFMEACKDDGLNRTMSVVYIIQGAQYRNPLLRFVWHLLQFLLQVRLREAPDTNVVPLARDNARTHLATIRENKLG